MTNLLDEFRARYQRWWTAFYGSGPLYCLPKKAIEFLSAGTSRRKLFVGAADAEAECAFLALCGAHDSIGVWRSAPIVYPCLMPMKEWPEINKMKSMGWTSQQIASVRSMAGKTRNIWRRLKGYVGWLVLDPDFGKQRDELASTWNALRSDEQPGFPLARSCSLPTAPPEARKVGAEAAEFQTKLEQFLTHWSLTKMVTWDLPEPQGPLIPALIKLDSPAMPRHGLHIVLPTHYPLTGDDSLLEEIREQQLQIARELGLDRTIAGLPHFDAYGKLFEVHHLETTIRSRYRQPRGGFVLQMEQAIAQTLGLNLSYVQKLRRTISAIQRGKRSTIKWLSAKSRA
ncbi:MAG TPA: hypothetical protein VMJ32_14905 [Pirellulales bacterium]|nr:hypothetical protein [Pirellulales bacterium]